ncbi:alpha/beta fold hydrolase [Luteibacter aegosomatis]
MVGAGAVAAASVAIPLLASEGAANAAAKTAHSAGSRPTSGKVLTKDGVEIFYKDWGPKDAQPIAFHHGWPLSSDDWDNQMLYFLNQGYRVVAHDRRGHGRSTQVDFGHDLDHYAADASAVAEYLDLKNAIHVGHSTGGGEVVRYVAKYGQPQGRVAKAVIMAAIPPLMLKTANNPGGTPIEVFDGFRKALLDNRSQFYLDVASGPFYGYNRAANKNDKTMQGNIQNWWRQGMMGGAKAHYDGIKAFSETDQTDDLKALTVPVLVLAGDDDQVVPYKDAAELQGKLIKNATVKIYPGYPHGLMTTHADEINAEILKFIKK